MSRNPRDAETSDAVKSQWISAMHELKELTFDLGGVHQACIFSPQTKHTEAWNKINCHY